MGETGRNLLVDNSGVCKKRTLNFSTKLGNLISDKHETVKFGVWHWSLAIDGKGVIISTKEITASEHLSQKTRKNAQNGRTNI